MSQKHGLREMPPEKKKERDALPFEKVKAEVDAIANENENATNTSKTEAEALAEHLRSLNDQETPQEKTWPPKS